MTKKLEFKLVVLEDGAEIARQALSYETMSSIVSSIPDNEANEAFFSIMAHHPSVQVRENVAYKDNISEETVQLLAKDKSVAVLRNIVRNSKFKESATLEQLLAFLEIDVDVAQSIAGNISDYSEADSNKLAQAVANHPDPSVAYYLADSYSAPKKILKALTTHIDPNVASAAKRTLDNQ